MDSHNKLWVDKHHPNRITELLGDATVQRQLLHTFIGWKQSVQSSSSLIDSDQSVSSWKGSQRWEGNKNTLIVWGPPGIGKTVAIPMLLQHVGFQVHYISAIEENGWNSLLSKVEALRNKSCLFASQLPPCIVLDDVVFAAGQVTNVDKCIKILSDNAKGGVNSTGALKNSVWVVIICEDAYSRGLATLRPFAKIVHFGQSDTKSLLFRSMRVLTNERNEANGHDISQQERDFLKYLCEAAAGDIRWVLNQLQFVQNHFQYLPVSFQQFDDFKDLSRSNMIDIMNSIFECQNKEQQIYYRYFCGLSVAEYDSLLDICPTIAMTAVETSDDLKQLTEIFDLQFYVANLSRPLSYEIESVVKDIDAVIIKKYTQLIRKVHFVKHFREKRLEQQRMRTNIAALQELRNSWMSSFARFDKTQQTAETYPRLTSLIYHSIKNASKLTEIKQRIEAIQKIAKIFRCYGISVTWESKDLLEEDEMETQLTHHKSWNFVPTLPQLSYFEDMSPWQTETQSFMETLSILIGILENPESEVEHLASQKERDSWLTVDSNASTTNGDERTVTHVCFRFHEGHSNAILKPVTIDMFSC
ncbi:chromosome transmission fidelity protein 18 [Galdieria sulphuraria]|uniref:Chromosome transmission fidelity protein 18 n=1 Tax=Galdieria sulphuraria TaxID=130081 RepID=M2X5V0_GALSU|nr:chromosome transmission fidelity protein 18 [Galdieria sulphuraria]EME31845.1 chromosome transmission fidelity protein 18 [Galdieria sulphuraria]|eukprot:XP_005708365.1 chromosome transmission fidelity protein 18 [Galdieria sulphuraria]